jgi:Domain of unknown function (DUF4375)
MDHAAVMNSCAEKAERVGTDALSAIERVIVLVSRVNFEVELGGFSAFLTNSSGLHARETVPALKAVGAKKAAAALQNALNARPDDYDPLDEQFERENPDVFARLCSYIDAHATELAEHGA